ncbi:MAG: hypothetical protein IPJ06_05570 [Saprospiraceae bacterium]|nr:hypothetical protein [Saprospiraceae bacterium]
MKNIGLVQLQEWNDGTASIYHAEQYANLREMRPEEISVPENTILNVHNAYGFHPSMQD